MVYTSFTHSYHLVNVLAKELYLALVQFCPRGTIQDLIVVHPHGWCDEVTLARFQLSQDLLRCFSCQQHV